MSATLMRAVRVLKAELEQARPADLLASDRDELRALVRQLQAVLMLTRLS